MSDIELNTIRNCVIFACFYLDHKEIISEVTTKG